MSYLAVYWVIYCNIHLSFLHGLACQIKFVIYKEDAIKGDDKENEFFLW